ncbi:MAG: hypothetical protein R3B90_20345 [Planctomycetaceae bacterium]
MHFFYDSLNDRAGGGSGADANSLVVNVNNTVTGQNQFSRNVGDGVDIELWDSNAVFSFNNHHSFNNGGDGIRFVTFAENINGSFVTNVAPDFNNNPGTNAFNETTTPDNARLLGEATSSMPIRCPAVFPRDSIRRRQRHQHDRHAVDPQQQLPLQRPEGIDIAVGAATLQAVTIRNTQMFANANTDFLSRTITNEVAVKQVVGQPR